MVKKWERDDWLLWRSKLSRPKAQLEDPDFERLLQTVRPNEVRGLYEIDFSENLLTDKSV